MTLTRQLLSRELQEPDCRALLASARRLRQVARHEKRGLPLKGRHIAVANTPARGTGAELVAAAAEALGARVSRIGAQALCRADDRPALARMLGSLYDAVDCSDLDAARALELHELAGVPVFDGLADEDNPLRGLLPQMSEEAACDGSASQEDRLAALVQAVLLETVS
jgi:ornithine carbamoyltransferase